MAIKRNKAPKRRHKDESKLNKAAGIRPGMGLGIMGVIRPIGPPNTLDEDDDDHPAQMLNFADADDSTGGTGNGP